MTLFPTKTSREGEPTASRASHDARPVPATPARHRLALPWAAIVAMAGLSLLPACQPAQPIVPDDLRPAPIATQSVPDYGDLVRAYNANAAAVDRVYVRTGVAMRWRDENGKARRESGDGRLIFRRPLDTALTVEVLGDVKLWAGGDETAFWLFDLYDTKTAFHGDVARPLARPLPLPVRPEAVPWLLGLMPLDPDRRPAKPEVELVNGYALIEPPGLNLRMLLHPETGRPQRVDLIAPDGGSFLRCVLSGELEVPPSSATGSGAVLPAKADIYPEHEESRLTVDLKSSVDPKKIRGTWFRFEDLRRALRPKAVESLNEP